MDAPLSTPLSHVLVAFTIEFDNEFERRFADAGGGARVTSLVMWSNFLRFVGDGITVGELPAIAGLPQALIRSTLGGMERWRYVEVGRPGEPVTAKRDGYGSGRALQQDWVIRPTAAGRSARDIWQPLFGDIEARWVRRFGAPAVEELGAALRVVAGQLDGRLPEYLPILGTANGMAVDLPPAERVAPEGRTAARRHLAALLAQVLLAYAIDFERTSEVSLPLSANFLRVLDETGMTARDLAAAGGVSNEATSMAQNSLARSGHVDVDGRTKVVRLTPQGRAARESARPAHVGVGERWARRFGSDAAGRLRSALGQLLDQPAALSCGLQPHPEGWRASKPYLARTRAIVDDPCRALPHYPMVLHRGGWPDGS